MRLRTILTALLVLALALSACGAGKGAGEAERTEEKGSAAAADTSAPEEAAFPGETGGPAEEEDLFRNVSWEGGGSGLQRSRESLAGQVVEICLSISRQGDPEKRTEALLRRNLDHMGVPYALGSPEASGTEEYYLTAAVSREDFDWLTWQVLVGGAGSFVLESAGRTIESGQSPMALVRGGGLLEADVSERNKMALYLMTAEAVGTRPVWLTAGGAPLAFAEPEAPAGDGILPLTRSCLTGRPLTEEELDRMDIFRAILEEEPYPAHIYAACYCLESDGEREQSPDLPEMDLYREAADSLFARLSGEVPALRQVDMAPEPVFYLALPAGEDLAGAYREAIDRLRELCPLDSLPGRKAAYLVCDPDTGKVQFRGTLSVYGEPEDLSVFPFGLGDPDPAYEPWMEALDDVLLTYMEGF